MEAENKVILDTTTTKSKGPAPKNDSFFSDPVYYLFLFLLVLVHNTIASMAYNATSGNPGLIAIIAFSLIYGLVVKNENIKSWQKWLYSTLWFVAFEACNFVTIILYYSSI